MSDDTTAMLPPAPVVKEKKVKSPPHVESTRR